MKKNVSNHYTLRHTKNISAEILIELREPASGFWSTRISKHGGIAKRPVCFGYLPIQAAGNRSYQKA
jgi:hypothetical protein